MVRALKINPRDNVAVVLTETLSGETIEVATGTETIQIQARQPILFGHKVALANLKTDQPIIKYGEEIGRAQMAIEAGDWIHLHNLYCRRGHEEQTE